ncbi:MAG: glycoside hydrolase family 3 C-terminal domain-containing protein [Lachnospiraceae bacterium]|nr:glycoside hydrolase family 3 C-terminal domain-containing protein [Lachnospiraceae bacterium]
MFKRRGKMWRSMSVVLSAAMVVGSATSVSAAITDADESWQLAESHVDTAVNVASEGMVLLENDGALPLTSDTVALYGAGTWNTIRGGTGSGATYLRDSSDNVTVYDGFKDAGYTIANESYVEAYTEAWEESGSDSSSSLMGSSNVAKDVAFSDEELADIESMDPSIPVIYTLNRISGEGSDRTLTAGDYYLTDDEKSNLETLGAHFDNVIVVLNIGGVIDTSFYNGSGETYYEDVTDDVTTFSENTYFTKNEDGEYESASEYDEDETYYSFTEVGKNETFSENDMPLYKEADDDSEETVSINGVYYEVVREVPSADDILYNKYYKFVVVSDVNTYAEYVKKGVLYTMDGNDYVLVTEDDPYDSSATYYIAKDNDKIEGLTALVDMSQGGTQSGTALVNVLSGETPFSGKTVDTWAKNFSDYPSSEGFSWLDNDTVEENYSDDIYVGYRYFDTYGIEPAYPFGYGLTYSDFDINVNSVKADTDNVTVTATVTNTGEADGKEVVEVYFSAPQDGDIDVPFQELAAYGKTDLLSPGESDTLTITFPTEDLSSYDETNAEYVIQKGDYKIRVGNSSRNTVVASELSFDDDVVTEKCENLFTLTKDNMESGTYDSSATMSSKSYAIDMLDGSKDDDYDPIEPTTEGLTTSASDVELSAASFPEAVEHTYTHGEVTAYVSADSTYEAGEDETLETVETSGDGSYTLADVYEGKITEEQLLADLSVDELIDLTQGGSDTEATPSTENSDIIGYQAPAPYGGTGGTTTNLYNSRFIPNTETADGGAGIRISTDYSLYEAVPQTASYDENETYYTMKDNAYGGDTYNEIEISSEDEFNELLASSTRIYTYVSEAYQYCTATPIATDIAQTWNSELAIEEGRAVQEEMLAYDITYWLAPAMNIHRNPLCGRNFEYYSEDPVVTAGQAGAITHGVMTNEDGSASGVTTMIKHYAANSQENNRMGSNSMVSERALREIYLKGFEKIVENEQPYAIMTAYNQINGVPTYNNYSLMTEITRNEWGFEGFFCSDWYSYYGSYKCAASTTSATTPGTGAESYDSGSDYAVTASDAYKTQGWQLEAGLALQMPGYMESTVRTAWENDAFRLGSLQACAKNIIDATLRSKQFSDLYEKLDAAGLRDDVSYTLKNVWGKTYVYDQNGDIVTGFFEYEGTKMYANEKGQVIKNKKVTVDGDTYFVDSTGAVAADELVTIWGKSYYFDSEGKQVSSSFFEYDGNTMYADENGQIVKSKLLEVDGVKYYIYKDGTVRKNQFVNVWGTYYYAHEDGHLAESEFVEVDGNTYYFNADGKRVKGWQTIDGAKYFFNSNGVMTKGPVTE